MTTELMEADPRIRELQEEVGALGVIYVVSPDTYKAAGDRWKALCAAEKKVHEMFDPTVDAQHKAWKAGVALRSKFLDPLEVSKKGNVAQMKSWEREEERKRQEAERAAQDAARKAAEDAAIADAAALEKAGFKEEAKQIVDTPVAVPQVTAPTVVPKGFGSATRTMWKAEVVDLKALVAAVAVGKVPLAVLQPNMVVLGQQARALKAEMKYPGIRVWEE